MFNITSGPLKGLKPIHLIVYPLLTFLVLVINYPFIWMALSSLKTEKEFYVLPIKLFPESFVWQNYVTAWNHAPWATYIKNSFITSIIPVFGQVTLGSLAAYAFTRTFKLNKLIFTLFLGVMMIPGQATLIPNYVIIRNLGWINSYYALIVPFMSGTFSIFLIRQYFLSIPKDYEDAAFIDGASPFYFLLRVLVPLSMPAMVTVSLLTFNDRWNDYLYSMIMVTRDAMRTVQVGMGAFQGEQGIIQWGYLTAASTFITIPTIVLFLFVQKRFIDGVMMSGIKG